MFLSANDLTFMEYVACRVSRFSLETPASSFWIAIQVG